MSLIFFSFELNLSLYCFHIKNNLWHDRWFGRYEELFTIKNFPLAFSSENIIFLENMQTNLHIYLPHYYAINVYYACMLTLTVLAVSSHR